MGITQDGLLKRRKTGGKPAQYMKKRKFAMGRPASNTKLGAQRVRTIRVRFGLTKKRALRLDSGTYSWGSEGISRKTRILSVVYNPTNNEFVRTNTIVKGEIVAVDATPFKLWYETYYGVAIGRRVVVHKTDAKGAKKGTKAPAKGAVKGVVKGAAKSAAKAPAKAAAKDAKPAAAKPAAAKPAAAKDAAKPAAKEAKPAAAKPAAAKGVTKTITKPDAKAAAKAPAKAAAKGAAAPAKGAAPVKGAAKGAVAPAKAAAKGGKTDKTEVVDKKKDFGPLPAKHLKAIPNAVPGTLTGTFIDQNKSKLVRAKHAQRARRRVLEPLFEEQFSSGRLLACISSRPGQSGAADGYLLEGKELDFYLKKVKKTK